MSAETIIPPQTSFHKLFSIFEKLVNSFFNERTSSLVKLCQKYNIPQTEIADAIKYNPSLITRYFPKGANHDN